MNICLLAVSGLMSFLLMAAIFIIIFLTIKTSLNHSSLFGKKTTVFVAVCVTALCLIGMSEYLLILLPFAALGIAILLTLLFLFLAGIFGSEKPKAFGKKNKTSIAESSTKQSDFRKRLRES